MPVERKAIQLRIPDDLAEKVATEARLAGRSVNNLIERILQESIGRRYPQPSGIYDRLADPGAYPIVGGEVDTTPAPLPQSVERSILLGNNGKPARKRDVDPILKKGAKK